MKEASMKLCSSPLYVLAIAGTLALSMPVAHAQAPDPILDSKQVKVLLDAYYAKQKQRLRAEIARREPDQVLYLTGKHLSEVTAAIGDKHQIPPIVPAAAALPDPCALGQTFFIRRNALDTFQLGNEFRNDPLPVAKAKGASFSFTQDQLANTNTATINGRIQAIAFAHDALSTCVDGKVTNPWATASTSGVLLGYMIAPFIDMQGTAGSPRQKGETSALQGGIDMQLAIFRGPLFDHQYLTLTPYYQTDFRGLADIQGVTAAWTPILPDIHLGGRIGVPDPYVDWFWQFQAAYDERHVTSPGVTGLANRSYQWVGAVAQVHLMLFPDLSAMEPAWKAPFPALLSRFYINGVANYYHDADSGMNIHLFEAELGYNINTDGSSSISVKYDRGTDKDTLTRMQKYVVSLNYKF
jgi:hypothetical protein